MGALEDDHAVDWLGHQFFIFYFFFMQELVLQEEGIERVDPTLGTLCQHLKILYMPNNLIARLGKTSFLTSITMCLFGWFWSTRFVRDDLRVEIVSVAIVLISFGSHMDMLIVKVKVLFPHIMSIYRSFLLCWLLNLERSTHFEYVVQSLLNTCLFGVRF